MINNKSETTNKNVQAIFIMTIFIVTIFVVWIIYSAFNFHKIYSETVVNENDSYIDKQGLEEVKLKIENRKN